jgi:hypothetical protein
MRLQGKKGAPRIVPDLKGLGTADSGEQRRYRKPDRFRGCHCDRNEREAVNNRELFDDTVLKESFKMVRKHEDLQHVCPPQWSAVDQELIITEESVPVDREALPARRVFGVCLAVEERRFLVGICKLPRVISDLNGKRIQELLASDYRIEEWYKEKKNANPESMSLSAAPNAGDMACVSAISVHRSVIALMPCGR